MSLETIRVLSVEDNAGDARLIQEMLREAIVLGWDLPQFELVWVQTLAKAQDRLDEGGVDVVLSDLDLPDSQAGDTIERLRAHVPHMPIVVLTGREDELLARQAVRTGVEDYLFKRELSGSLLAHALIYALERQRSKAALQQAHDELEQRVRERTTELERANIELQREIKDHRHTEAALRERVKELNCLFGVAKLIEQPDMTVSGILQGTVGLMPPAWQYPGITAARITWDGQEFQSPGFDGALPWQQAADIVVRGVPVGTVEVCYSEQRPPRDEGPFLKEERYLIDAIAERLGRVIERVQAQETLRQNMALLKESQAISHVGSWQLDLLNNHLTWSDEIYRMFGLEPREFAATYEAFLEAVHPDDRAAVDAAYSGSLREGQDSYEIEHRVIRRDNAEVRIVHEKCTHVRDSSGRIVRSIGMVQDITERKRTEAQLRHYAAELQRSNQDLQQFAHVASHDLQEPLRTIDSFIHLLAKRCQGQLDEQADRFIDFIVDGVGRMQELLQSLLAYSRIGSAGHEPAPTDSEAVLRRALAGLGRAIAESGAEITHDPLPTVWADAVQLAQLFQNLIGNAIKFRSAEPPRVHVSAERDGGGWTFAVRDNGIGIAPQDHERIFEPFSRLHTREEYPGTGMGLAICARIVARHGGRMGVESRPGQGATFYFSLPAGPVPA